VAHIDAKADARGEKILCTGVFSTFNTYTHTHTHTQTVFC
jgi:hypothetical protein